MSNFVNWDFLSREINKFTKTARSEAIDPADREYLDQAKKSLPSANTDGFSDQSENNFTRDVLVNSVDPDEKEEQEYIEVENINGKIKKIDPDDYQVVFTSTDGKILFSGTLKNNKPYWGIFKKHGLKEALHCLAHDLKNNPEIIPQNQLSLLQAKMIASSLINTVGSISEKSINDLMFKLNKQSQTQLRNWLENKKS